MVLFLNSQTCLQVSASLSRVPAYGTKAALIQLLSIVLFLNSQKCLRESASLSRVPAYGTKAALIQLLSIVLFLNSQKCLQVSASLSRVPAYSTKAALTTYLSIQRRSAHALSACYRRLYSIQFSSMCSAQQGLPAGEPCIGARHVQQCMWTGRNRPDAAVPLHAAHYQMLLTSKVQKWQDDNSFNPYLTTSQA